MPTPRKIAGREIKMIEELIVAMKIPSVVLVRATHLYRGETSLFVVVVTIAR